MCAFFFSFNSHVKTEWNHTRVLHVFPPPFVSLLCGSPLNVLTELIKQWFIYACASVFVCVRLGTRCTWLLRVAWRHSAFVMITIDLSPRRRVTSGFSSRNHFRFQYRTMRNTSVPRRPACTAHGHVLSRTTHGRTRPPVFRVISRRCGLRCAKVNTVRYYERETDIRGRALPFLFFFSAYSSRFE